MEYLLSKSAKHVQNESKAVLVWFGGLHEPFLNPSFLAASSVDALLLIDTEFNWYMQGLGGLPGGFPASVAWLKSFITRNRYEQVFLSGQSSGGYAALRFARALNPTGVIAFAPQTRNLNGRPHIELEDLTKAYDGWDGDFPIRLHVARSEKENKAQYFWNDWEQIKPFLELNNVTVIRHPFDGHAISLPLYERQLFYKTILADMSLYLASAS